jgi:hypothetical protein
LLGESVKKLPGQEKAAEFDHTKKWGQIASQTACSENEAFLKMMEDPMVYIRQKELEARHSVFENPLKMKQIREEIERLKNGGSKKHKKSKKDKKKSKKSKKHRKHRSSSSSSSSRSSRSSSPD